MKYSKSAEQKIEWPSYNPLAYFSLSQLDFQRHQEKMHILFFIYSPQI